jgi:Tol biopolymer transport system component
VYTAVRAGRQELWERSIADRRDRLMIASSEWSRTRPHWSPDGTRVAYARRRAGANMADAVVAVLTVPDGEERLVTRPGDTALVPSDWSTDGNRLLGGCPQGRGRPIGTCVLDMSVEPASQPRVQVLAADPKRNLFEQRFSPDQRWVSFIAVSSVDAGVSTIFVMPASGGPWRDITEGFAYDDKPHWAPDGRTIYFASNRNGLFNIWGRRFDPATGTPVGAPFQVTSFQSPGQTLSTQLSRMQFAMTSNRLFLPITETSGELWMLENVEPR